MTDGSVWCWGYNQDGELGDGSKVLRPLPTRVAALPAPASRLSAGYYFTCALTTSASAWCWGYNYAGQLGDGTIMSRLQPTRVSIPCP